MSKVRQVDSISMDFPVENAFFLHTLSYAKFQFLLSSSVTDKIFSAAAMSLWQDTVRGEQATFIYCWHEIDDSITLINLRSDNINAWKLQKYKKKK